MGGIGLVLGTVAIGGWALRSTVSGPKSVTEKAQPVPQPAERVETPPKEKELPFLRPVEKTTELVGAYMGFGEERLRITDLVWGIRESGEVGYAVLTGVREDGSTYTSVSTEQFDRYATRVSELAGTQLVDAGGGDSYLLADLRMAIDHHGDLVIYYWNGIDEEGTERQFGDPAAAAAGGICCTNHVVTICIKATCSGACPTVPPCECDGTGNCGIALATICRGGCAPGNPCPWTGQCNGNALNCRCE